MFNGKTMENHHAINGKTMENHHAINGKTSPCHYALVNVHITMENHHCLWVNPPYLWPFSIATLNYQRVMGKHPLFQLGHGFNS